MSLQPESASPQIAQGAVIGGRFEVVGSARTDSWGEVLRASDQKTGKPVSLRRLHAAFISDEAASGLLQAQVKTAAALRHRNVTATYGLSLQSEHGFLASEWVEGSSLAEFVRERGQSGQQISTRGAYNVISHVCRALSYAHPTTIHGMLRPSVVWVQKSGRVKVDGFCLASAGAKLGAWKALPESEQAFLAPEVRSGGPPDVRCDVFGVGALLYVLLTGRSPTDSFQRPSQVHPQATEALDQVLLRCLARNPEDRYSSAAEIAEALRPLVSELQNTDQPLGIDVEIDVQFETIPPAEPAQEPEPSFRAVRRPANPLSAATAPLAAAETTAAETAAAGDEAASEVAEALARITETDSARWMLIKDGLDHGPFTGRELVDLVVKGEALAEHGLLDMDTNERKSLAEFGLFDPFIEQYRIRKTDADQREAIERSHMVERRTNTAKVVALAATAGLVVFGVVGYLASRPDAEKENVDVADLAALYESGQVKVKSSVGILKAPRRGKRVAKAKARTRAGSKGKANGSKAGGLTYEQAMMQAVEMNAAKSGGERQLGRSSIQGVMDKRLNSMFSCVGQELRRGGRLRTVTIDMAIAGSGKVMGASVRGGGSPAFQRCIRGKVRKIQFPSFPAPRMGARYAFDVD